MHYRLKIYVGLKKLPKDSRSESIAYRLPDDIAAHPLSRDISVEEAFYYFKSVETIYLASEEEFKRFNLKLCHTIRYSIWQRDALEPGPFRDLIWPGDYIKRTALNGLLTSFTEWDARIRALDDIEFYKVYCTIRKAIRRFSEVSLGTDTLTFGEIFLANEYEPHENSIQYPFAHIELDLEERIICEPTIEVNIPSDPFGDRDLI